VHECTAQLRARSARLPWLQCPAACINKERPLMQLACCL